MKEGGEEMAKTGVWQSQCNNTPSSGSAISKISQEPSHQTYSRFYGPVVSISTATELEALEEKKNQTKPSTSQSTK